MQLSVQNIAAAPGRQPFCARPRDLVRILRRIVCGYPSGPNPAVSPNPRGQQLLSRPRVPAFQVPQIAGTLRVSALASRQRLHRGRMSSYASMHGSMHGPRTPSAKKGMWRCRDIN